MTGNSGLITDYQLPITRIPSAASKNIDMKKEAIA